MDMMHTALLEAKSDEETARSPLQERSSPRESGKDLPLGASQLIGSSAAPLQLHCRERSASRRRTVLFSSERG